MVQKRRTASAPRRVPGPGFTLIELVMALAVVGVLAAVLLPAARRVRLADGLTQSTANVRQLLIAAVRYRLDHAGQMPMRGAQYTSGMLSGWDTWNFAGKNCDLFWAGNLGGLFDESGYSRPLNSYLHPARIPHPPGYLNTGSGSTWNFRHGMPTVAQRASLQVPVCRSPGDTFTYEPSWPIPNFTRSTYDDVGTSYLLNMTWWDQPGLPSGFTAKYNEGVRRIGLAFDGANPNFVWIGDKYIDFIPYGPSNTATGEFGKPNACVSGFADGTVRYLKLVPGAHEGPGYTLWP